MSYYYLNWADWLLTPFYLILITFIAVLYRFKFLKKSDLRPYFLPGIFFKIIGAISIVFIYQFYYNGGDTTTYYSDSLVITEAILKSPSKALILVNSTSSDKLFEVKDYTSRMFFFGDKSTMFVIVTAAIINIFTFSSYLITSIFFSILGFSGSWALFATLNKIEPVLKSKFALSVLFLPSLFFWGAGLLKDTLTLSALGWLIFGFYNLVILRKTPIKSLVIIILSAYIIITVKVYILVCLLPALSLWLFILYGDKIKSKKTKVFLKPLLFILAIFAGLYSTYLITLEDKHYNVDNIAETSKQTAQWIAYVSKAYGGSFYDIGEFDFTLLGVIKIFPAAVNVTLFRPYLWEIRNPLMLISSLESLLFFIITIYVIYKCKIYKFVNIISNNEFILASLCFAITFSFAVGISTMNFGTLARYKIPALPFYLSSLFYILHICKNPKQFSKR